MATDAVSKQPKPAELDPPDNDYPKTGHDASGRGVLFTTSMTNPWGGSLKISLSIDPFRITDSPDDVAPKGPGSRSDRP